MPYWIDAATKAAMVKVTDLISSEDEMFQGDRAHYFAVGERATRAILLNLAAADVPSDKVHRVLDLPCGHGRVMRFLTSLFPDAHFSACDINRSGVDFCARTFNAEPIYSKDVIEDVPLQGDYDLIWCGSLFTHFDFDNWQRWLLLFRRHLAMNGVILVTLHGRRAADRVVGGWSLLNSEQRRDLLHGYREQGFGYVDYTHTKGFGFSLSTPANSVALAERIPDVRILSYTEGGWGIQDVLALQRTGSAA